MSATEMNRIESYKLVNEYLAKNPDGSLAEALEACGFDPTKRHWVYDVRARLKRLAKNRKNVRAETPPDKKRGGRPVGSKNKAKVTPTLVTLEPQESKKKDITILMGDSDEIMKVLERARQVKQ